MLQNEIRRTLEKYGHEHVLRFYGELNDSEREILEKQIEDIDYAALDKLASTLPGVSGKAGSTDTAQEAFDITPLPCVIKDALTEEERRRYCERGMEIMRSGRFAAITMAGGQGTRLGHTGPKGTFYVNIPEPKSLFEIQCERLKERSKECARTIPWYIMTSEENDAETRRFFEENSYFGYPKEDILFFRQLMMPMLDENGKLMLEDKYTIKRGADGHGGIFRAMDRSGVISDMKKRGVEWIFVGGIDNILVRLADPVFTGFLSCSGYLLGGKSLIKRDAYEKAGVFCMKNGRPFVIEYTEISKELAELKDDKGEFVYGDAHILCNMFNIKVLENMGSEGLPYHIAHKKAAYIDENGCKVTPDSPNAYKFEAFIFDAFASQDKMGILRVKRELEFAPIKNKTGEDSPETARELYMKGAHIRE